MKVFGIGCIIFRYINNEKIEDENFKISQFKRDIIASLEAVENVTNVNYLNIDEESVGFRSFEYDEDDNINPIPCGFELSFDLYIPHKIQAYYGFTLDVENFHISIVYGHDRPIAYCSYEWGGAFSESDPSSAVSVIRKYLADRISGKIICHAIGPSPFHCDFCVEESANESYSVVDNTIASNGYGRITFLVPNSDNLIEEVIYKYNGIFSRFYYLSTQRSILIRIRTSLMNQVNKLIREEKSNTFSRIIAHFSTVKEIDGIHRDVVLEKITRMETEQYIQEGDRENELGNSTPFEIYFKEYREIISAGGWSELGEVAKFFEERRQKLFENLSVLIAGIIGGVIGACATLYLSKSPITPPSSAPSSSISLKHEPVQPIPPPRSPAP